MTPLNATIEELKRAGLDYRVEHGSKHIKVKVDGLPMIVCSFSCSDHRGENAARTLVRRLIRQSGLGAIA